MVINRVDSTADKEQIKDLWQYAFSESKAFLSLYFGEFWQGQNAVSALCSGRLAGALELVPYQISLRGHELSASYIVGVSTAPEMRGQGIAKSLMHAALEKQAQRKEALSLLQPFSYSFYHKMGYALCYEETRCSVTFSQFPKVQSALSVFPASLEDYEELNTVYHTFCKDKNGFVCRTRKDWNFIFKLLKAEGGYMYACRDAEGVLCGYISFIKDAKRFLVLEAAYTTQESLKALLSFTAAHFSTYSQIDFTLPTNSTMPALFPEPPVCRRHPFVMARIIDVCAVLTGGLEEIHLSVTDDFYSENTGVYYELDGQILRADNLLADAKTDIGSLSQLIMGYRSAKELCELGLMEASFKAIDTLDRLYPKQQNYINHILTNDK
ncbi:MAG: GNAT family N-acetyltransferase [Clostridia bacterium]|nr:GNAT family N-acetyltransferase [Clostridia bacterium]